MKLHTNFAQYNALPKTFFLTFLIAITAISCSSLRKNNPTGSYFHGYLYTTSGDTLEGRIKLKASYENKVTYKPDGQKKSQTYEVAQLNGLQINLIKYGKIAIDGKPKLIEKVAYGTFDLYAYNQAHKDQLKTYYYFKVSDDEIIRLTKANYLEVLGEHLRGVQEIEDLLYYEEIDYDQVIYLIRRYNRLTITD